MRFTIFIAIVCLFAGSLACRSSNEGVANKRPIPAISPSPKLERVLHELDFEVNGIKSGTSYDEIVKRIGKPLRSQDLGKDDCNDRDMRTIYYKGLAIELESDGTKQSYAVVSIEVTSARWLIGNKIKIGSTRDEVLKAFGPDNDYADDDALGDQMPRLEYVTKENLGGVTFLLIDEKVFKVIMSETLC